MADPQSDVKFNTPVFIGGTGRSGTSILADIIGTHPDIYFACHENKLISERCGLRDIVDVFAGGADILRRHFAVVNFYGRAASMTRFGFRDPALNQKLSDLCKKQGMGFQQAFEVLQRENPHAPGSIHAIGHAFDEAYFEKCVKVFLNQLVAHIDQNGIVDTDGLLKPFFLGKDLDRAQALALCREFLFALYAKSGPTRWVDDTPSNALYVDFLYELFPKMKFIHMVRNPADVVSSYVKQVWFPSDVNLAAKQVSSMLLKTEDLSKKIPKDNFLTVRMEDLVTETEDTVAKVAAFVGVDNRFNHSVVNNEAANIGRAEENPEIKEAVDGLLGGWKERHGYAS
ncbi:sulfotransferase family protein [Thalassospira alkalitolerans]|uniref:sulfotransferase family protein n=1 Tax=Thalassospira alkalitolerans TaxID=1293890 RepID=UPI003AA8042F